MREMKYWLLNAFCAVVILVLLGIHMGIMHLDSLLTSMFGVRPDPLAWENMLARGRSAFFTLTYVLLLATGLFHGFYGLRTMLLEYWSGARVARVVTWSCWLAGVALFAVGTYATVTFQLIRASG